MGKTVKSGKEILDDFFQEISRIPGVDSVLAGALATLYQDGKLTDANVKNELLRLRETDGHQDQ